MAKKKIILAIESLSVGGAERIVIDLANNMNRDEWKAHVVCLSTAGELAGQLDDIPLHVLGKKPGLDFSIIDRIRYLTDEIKPDIINSHLWTANTWMRFALRKSDIPLIATEHNRDLWKRLHHRVIDRYLAKFTRAIIAVSDDAADFYRENIGIPSHLIHVIHNGINLGNYANGEGGKIRDELGIDAETPLIGTVGRMVPQKNQLRLIEAMAGINKAFPNAICVIAGDGPERGRIESLVREKELENNVRLLGIRHDIPDILSALDIFVLSSDREGHPLTALEAQAAGTPVVLTDVGGSAMAIAKAGEKRGGVLVKPLAEEIAEKICGLLGNRDEMNAMAEFAKDYAAGHFGMQSMIDKYSKLFHFSIPKD
ncbi:MAG: glycosyltransferase [Planctomycetes bacterium]|nr:glycosyltransferase [Planctomycetota bacterium]